MGTYGKLEGRCSVVEYSSFLAEIGFGCKSDSQLSALSKATPCSLKQHAVMLLVEEILL